MSVGWGSREVREGAEEFCEVSETVRRNPATPVREMSLGAMRALGTSQRQDYMYGTASAPRGFISEAWVKAAP